MNHGKPLSIDEINETIDQITQSWQKSLDAKIVEDTRKINIGRAGLGRKINSNQKSKLMASLIGRKVSDATREKMAEFRRNFRHSEETKARMKTVHSSRVQTEEQKQGLLKAHEKSIEKNSKPVSIDGVVYPSFAKASEATGINRATIKFRINSSSEKFKGYFYVDKREST
ncbi:hypothetical protein [Burkholderia phage FLC8]|nr:hypothetical protein [Burkholderia phage FLC8]